MLTVASLVDFKKDIDKYFTPQDWNTKYIPSAQWSYDSRSKMDAIGKEILIRKYYPSKRIIDSYAQFGHSLSECYLNDFNDFLQKLKDKYPELWFVSTKSNLAGNATTFVGVLLMPNMKYTKYLQIKIPNPSDYNTYSDKDIDFIESQFVKGKIYYVPTTKLLTFFKDVDSMFKVLKSDLYWAKKLRKLVEKESKNK